jgi:hypothetical protein
VIGGRPGPSLGVTSQRGSNCPAKASAASRVPKAHRRTGLPGSDAIHTVAMVPLSCTRIERMYLHDVAMLTEAPSPCPQRHTYRPDTYIVGWDPCLCVAGRTGHRTYCCIHRHAAGRPAMRAYRVQFVGQGRHRAEPPVRSAEPAAGRVNDRRADRGWSRRGIRASSQRAVVIGFLTHVGHDRYWRVARSMGHCRMDRGLLSSTSSPRVSDWYRGSADDLGRNGGRGARVRRRQSCPSSRRRPNVSTSARQSRPLE